MPFSATVDYSQVNIPFLPTASEIKINVNPLILDQTTVNLEEIKRLQFINIPFTLRQVTVGAQIITPSTPILFVDIPKTVNYAIALDAFVQVLDKEFNFISVDIIPEPVQVLTIDRPITGIDVYQYGNGYLAVKVVEIPLSFITLNSLSGVGIVVLNTNIGGITEVEIVKPISIVNAFRPPIELTSDYFIPIQILDLFNIRNPPGEGNTMYYEDALGLQTNGIPELKTIRIVPLTTGQYVTFPFPVDSDPWVDESGWLYFKPTGRTIGKDGSIADYGRDDLELLFKRLHANSYLKLFNSNGNEVVKDTAETDWENFCVLALPYHPGATIVTPGRNSASEPLWRIGERQGTTNYIVPLPLHNHELDQQPHAHDVNISDHSHIVNQTPHTHTTTQTPHAHILPVHLEGNSDDFGGRDFDHSASGTFNSSESYANITIDPSNTNISLEPAQLGALASSEILNLSISPEGGDDQIQIITPGVGAEFLIFAGIRALPII